MDMKTYQDLRALRNREVSEATIIEFVRSVINDYESTEDYGNARVAYEYYKHKNVTINEYKKLLYRVTGEAVLDTYSPNYKLASRFFYRFVTQENQYLLGNGATFGDESTSLKLGKDFDNRLQELGKHSLIAGVAYGFFNLDHIDMFDALEFAPLFDENTGALRAGVRFWQIDGTKPLRATLYEEDGYTDYIWRKRDGEKKDYLGQVLNEKRPYIVSVQISEADGIEIVDGTNYPSFPIIPLYANDNKQSELVGLRAQIDAYDLIKSGFCNTVDEASLIYWIVNNAGGMDEVDLAKFLNQIRTVHAAVVEDDGATAEAHTMDIPYASREALLDRLRSDLYEDAMVLDTKNIANGNITATQIKASYNPLDQKTDLFEYQVLDFIYRLFKVAGIEDEVSFTRNVITNTNESVQVILQSAQYLSSDYITQKILTLLGDGDKAQEEIDKLNKYNFDRFTNDEPKKPEEEPTEQPADDEE